MIHVCVFVHGYMLCCNAAIGYRSAIDMFISKLQLLMHTTSEFLHTNKERSELDSPSELQPMYLTR